MLSLRKRGDGQDWAVMTDRQTSPRAASRPDSGGLRLLWTSEWTPANTTSLVHRDNTGIHTTTDYGTTNYKFGFLMSDQSIAEYHSDIQMSLKP